MRILSCVFALVLLQTSFAWGHPVSFRGSKGFISMMNPESGTIEANYSLRHWVSFGALYGRSNYLGAEGEYALVTNNYLLHRWNMPAAQANLYGLFGVGSSTMVEASGENVGFLGFQFDIEDRRYYLMTGLKQLYSESQRQMQSWMFRLGFAPYVGPFEDLHHWIILEAEGMQVRDFAEMRDLTPFLRFYYKTVLWEVGVSTQGRARFNVMTHF